MQEQERPNSSLSAHERLFGSSSGGSRENSSVSPPQSPNKKASPEIMSPIFKSDTARAIAKEVGLGDLTKPQRTTKKRSLTISGSNPAVTEALNNHQAKVHTTLMI